MALQSARIGATGDVWRCAMKLADWWAASLIVQYLIAAALYGLQGQGWKALYWLSASGIGMAVLRLR